MAYTYVLSRTFETLVGVGISLLVNGGFHFLRKRSQAHREPRRRALFHAASSSIMHTSYKLQTQSAQGRMPCALDLCLHFPVNRTSAVQWPVRICAATAAPASKTTGTVNPQPGTVATCAV